MLVLRKRDGSELRSFCNGCSKGVYFKMTDNYNFPDEYPELVPIQTENIVDYYPRLVPNIDPEIPKEIADDD